MPQTTASAAVRTAAAVLIALSAAGAAAAQDPGGARKPDKDNQPKDITDKPDSEAPVPTSKRGKRALRWEMLFKTQDNADYLRQLNALGAYIGIPDERGKLMIIKDLNERPAKPVYEDLRTVNRIFWVDS